MDANQKPSKCHILNVCPFLSFRSPSLSRSNGLEKEGGTFRTILISHSKAHFLLATKCASFLSHNFEYKKVCHWIEEPPFKIRKNCDDVSVIVINALNANQTKQMLEKLYFLYSGRANKSRNKKTTK